MSAAGFDRLHPAVQHHVVNSLGWPSLRPLQEAAIDPILDGAHALLVAATAAGKTEAAALPALSRILQEGWRGLSTIYVCPIKALLNDLEPRLSRLASLLGRRAALWHGDTSTAARKKLVSEPPDLLLTTPESLEAMLIFRREDREALFGRLRTVVVDELHAFAGDFRGWHLLAVLERLSRVAGRDLQRIGLSATVGNPEELLAWLAGSAKGERRLVTSPTGNPAPAELCLDWVSSLDNAATVISRLHRGEKRLVFCDSRSRVEQLASSLRRLNVAVHVSHGSLGLDERRRAEQAFREARDCVIVSTSTLELGLDVGDLDRVLQIDAPTSVASFLQRLGRTGRRPGTVRNCMFLATKREAFLQAGAILRLAGEGWVEPIRPPAEPLHLVAQQLLASTLEEGALPRHLALDGPVSTFARLAGIAPASVAEVLDYLLASGHLHDDQGLLTFGPRADQELSGRRLMELCSSFTSPPLFTVLHGREPLGTVHESSFQVPDGRQAVLLLGGRSWALRSVDWRRRTAWVEPCETDGRSRWERGVGVPSHARLARAVRDLLVERTVPARLTLRAQEQLTTLADELCWVRPGSTALVRDEADHLLWWTFAGLRANRTLAHHLAGLAEGPTRATDLSLMLASSTDVELLRSALAALPVESRATPPIDAAAVEGLKFSACLPEALSQRVLTRREADPEAVASCLAEPIGVVTDRSG